MITKNNDNIEVKEKKNVRLFSILILSCLIVFYLYISYRFILKCLLPMKNRKQQEEKNKTLMCNILAHY